MQEKPGKRNVLGKFLQTKSTNEFFPTLDIQSSKSLKFRLENTYYNTLIRQLSI